MLSWKTPGSYPAMINYRSLSYLGQKTCLVVQGVISYFWTVESPAVTLSHFPGQTEWSKSANFFDGISLEWSIYIVPKGGVYLTSQPRRHSAACKLCSQLQIFNHYAISCILLQTLASGSLLMLQESSSSDWGALLLQKKNKNQP